MSFNFKKTYSTPLFDIKKSLDPNYPDIQTYYRLTGFDSLICCVMTMK